MALQIQLKTSSVSQKLPLPTDLANGELALNFNADGPFISCRDTDGNVRRIGGLWVGDTPVSNPTVGDAWLYTGVIPSILRIYQSDLVGWVDSVTVNLATTSVFGIVRLATATDVAAGTIGRVVDASQLLSKTSTLVSSVSATSPLAVTGLPTQPNLTFAPGLPNQLLVTNASGTAVQFASNIRVPGTFRADGNSTFDSNVVIAGDLTVNGTTTTINTETIVAADKNIELNAVESPTDAAANGGGITLRGTTNKTILWLDATDSWTTSENVDLAAGKSYRINNVEVLSATALGPSVQISTNNIPAGTVTNEDLAGSIEDGKLLTIASADKVSLSAINIDGATDIGAPLADADLFIVDHATGGGNRKAAATRISTYVFGKVSGDATISSSGTVSAVRASALLDGFITNDDYIKLQGIEAGAQVNVATDLSYNAVTRLLASSTGADVTLPLADGTNAGLLSASDFTKLSGLTGNVQSDWLATEGDALILNKPTLGTAAAQDVTAFATAAQGVLAENALPKTGGTITGNLTITGSMDFGGLV